MIEIVARLWDQAQVKTTYWHHDQRNKSSEKNPKLPSPLTVEYNKSSVIFLERSCDMNNHFSRWWQQPGDFRSKRATPCWPGFFGYQKTKSETNSFSWLTVFRFCFYWKKLMVTKFSDLQSILHLVATTFINRIHDRNHRCTKVQLVFISQGRQLRTQLSPTPN